MYTVTTSNPIGENKPQEVCSHKSYCINYIKCIFWNKFIYLKTYDGRASFMLLLIYGTPYTILHKEKPDNITLITLHSIYTR